MARKINAPRVHAVPNTLKPNREYKPRLMPGCYPHDGYWAAIQKMANRMSVSQQKYGDVEAVAWSGSDTLASLKKRLDLYEQTGNTEWLLDVANLAVIEHLVPQRPNAHFRATDTDESPGLVGRPETKGSNSL